MAATPTMGELRRDLQLMEYGLRNQPDGYFPLSVELRRKTVDRAEQLLGSSQERVAVSALRVVATMAMVNAKFDANRVQEKSSDQTIAMAMLRETLKAEPALSSHLTSLPIEAESQAEPAASWAGWGKGDAPSDQGEGS